MKVSVKYLILITAFIAAWYSFRRWPESIGAGITAAGAFIAFAMIEMQDLKISNTKED